MTIQGAKVKALRQLLGFGRSKFSQLFNVSEQTIMRWEMGSSIPSQEQYAWLLQLEKGVIKAKEKEINIGELVNKGLLIGGSALGVYCIFKWAFEDNKDFQELIISFLSRK